MECSLSASDVLALFEKQNGLCALTGRPLVFGATYEQVRESLSIDRLDSNQGYVLGNIRLVTFQANFARNKYSDAELLSLCEDILRHHGYTTTRPGVVAGREVTE